MAVVWVTIPTAGRDTLEGAIDSTCVPRERIVIVATAPDVYARDCHVIEDFDEINIHRWWNRGIDYAQARGATHVLVLNDDTLLDESTIPALLDGMEGTAVIASPGDGGIFTNAIVPEWRAIDGSCWLLDLASGLRPDERFRWWYGDNDLDRRARRDHGGVASVKCQFTHLRPNHLTAVSPELQALAEQDQKLWQEVACVDS